MPRSCPPGLFIRNPEPFSDADHAHIDCRRDFAGCGPEFGRCPGRRAGRNTIRRRETPRHAVPPGRTRAVCGGGGSAYLRRARQRRRHRRALQGMGGAPREGGLCRAVSRQFRFARGVGAMRPAPAPGAGFAYADQRCARRPAVAAGAALGRRQPGFAVGLVARRDDGAVDHPPAQQRRPEQDPGFPLGGGAVSKLPARRGAGPGGTGGHPHKQKPVRAAAAPARRSSSIPARCTTSTARTSRRRNAAGSPIPQVRAAGSTSAPTRRRAPMRSSACRSGFRADAGISRTDRPARPNLSRQSLRFWCEVLPEASAPTLLASARRQRLRHQRQRQHGRRQTRYRGACRC
jgi:hypothetical protein